jgi:hypothetical protein
MRVMVLIKANADSEAGVMPNENLLTEMMAFNEELANAGIMKAGEGLHPSSKAKRIRFDGAKTSVIDGPFTETKELLAGFWIWEVKNMDEAVSWARRIPNPADVHGEVELRPVFDATDFGDAYTPELQEQEARIRAKSE